MTARRLPDDFLLGCSTSAHQVEGGIDNDWSRAETEHPGFVKDGSSAAIACDGYRRYRGDLDALAALGNTAHRFSIEWARVEPREGAFDGAALAHYRDVAQHCRGAGMEPVVTLHHFTLPPWLADRGGLLAADAPVLFARYAAMCAEAVGADVRWWVTVNEPAVLAVLGHLSGEWPPLRRSIREFLRAMRTTLRMHAAAAAALRTVAQSRGRVARVSIAHHERPLRALNGRSVLDRAASVVPNLLFNRWFLTSCVTGRVLPPVGRGESMPGLRGSLDYLALNYYCEERVRFNARRPAMMFAENVPAPGLPVSTFGWGIDALGLHRALLALWTRFHLPILITENGVADDHDELRSAFLVDHLTAVAAAMSEGVDVRGYLHWTSMDNFEWAEGYTKRFGLFSVDRDTLERTPKPSASLFAEICRTRMIPAP